MSKIGIKIGLFLQPKVDVFCHYKKNAKYKRKRGLWVESQFFWIKLFEVAQKLMFKYDMI